MNDSLFLGADEVTPLARGVARYCVAHPPEFHRIVALHERWASFLPTPARPIATLASDTQRLTTFLRQRLFVFHLPVEEVRRLRSTDWDTPYALLLYEDLTPNDYRSPESSYASIVSEWKDFSVATSALALNAAVYWENHDPCWETFDRLNELYWCLKKSRKRPTRPISRPLDIARQLAPIIREFMAIEPIRHWYSRKPQAPDVDRLSFWPEDALHLVTSLVRK